MKNKIIYYIYSDEKNFISNIIGYSQFPNELQKIKTLKM